MTYNVFSGTLNPTQSINLVLVELITIKWFKCCTCELHICLPHVDIFVVIIVM